MLLKKIKVENFRNIEHAELEFSPNANIFYGNNAQGKTNLLEAVSIALGKSFRNIRRNDIIPFGSVKCGTKTKICLSYETETMPGKINEVVYELEVCEKNVQPLPIVRINGIELKKAADLYGEFKYVTFIPDNLNILKGYPDTRRRYLDNIAVMQNKAHRKFQNEYRDVLKQRCAAGQSRYYYDDKEMMSVWNDILIRQGINLTYGRIKFLSLISEYASEIYCKLSGGENLGIVYHSDVFGNLLQSAYDFTDKENKKKLYEIYKSSLEKSEWEGQANKIPGVHKDDILFTINNNNARSYGSQGQLRSVAIALKLAEAEIIRRFNRENPVVLLDEVLGELDEKRRSFIAEQFVNSQVFITSCNNNDFKNADDMKVWNVENGVFTPWK